MDERNEPRSGDVGFSAIDVAGLILIIGLLTLALGALAASQGW